MKSFKLITPVNILVYLLTFSIIIYAKIVGLRSYELFYNVVKEDGIAEYLTALFLLGAAIIFAFRASSAVKQHNIRKLIFSVLMVFLFIFGLGEELSWGQRIFYWETSDFFKQHNYQGETNLHNLELWGININKLIFSQLMFVALGFYFIILPILVWRVRWIRWLVVQYGVPLPRFHHTVAILIQNGIVLSIGLLREGELHELSLAAILFLVFLAPATTVLNNKQF